MQSIAVPLQHAPVGQNLTSRFWLHTLPWLSSPLNNIHMPVPFGNCYENCPAEAFDQVGCVPSNLVAKCPWKIFLPKANALGFPFFWYDEVAYHFSDNLLYKFLMFCQNLRHCRCDFREPIIWSCETYRAQISVWRRKLFRFRNMSLPCHATKLEFPC